MTETPYKPSVFEIMQAHTTCAILSSLEEIGVATKLAADGICPADLGSNEFLANAALPYLSQRSIVQKNGELYHLTSYGRELYDKRGYLTWLSGGYGEALHNFGELLTGQKEFGKDIERNVRWVAVGTALASQRDIRPHVEKILGEIDFTCVSDIGCGNAHLLIDVTREANCDGVGIDISSDACHEARQEVEKAGFADRIEIVQADGRDPQTLPDLEKVDLVMTFFFLHEVLEEGYETLVSYLTALNAKLPAGAYFLTAEIAPPETDPAANEQLTPEYSLTQALMKQTLMDETGWEKAFMESGFERPRVVYPDMPEARLYLARKPLHSQQGANA